MKPLASMLGVMVFCGLWLPGCGGGSSAPGGGGGGTLTYAQRSAAMTAVSDKYAGLPHQDLKADNQALYDFIRGRPEFDNVYYEESTGGILAHFKGGPTLTVINNEPYGDLTRAARIPSRAAPNRGGRAIPAGGKAVLFNNFELSVYAAYHGEAERTISNAASALQDAGYTVERYDGTLQHLRDRVTPTDNRGIGLVYFNGHATSFRVRMTDTGQTSEPMYALRTATPINPVDDVAWTEEMKQGRVGPTLTGGFNLGRYFMNQTYYVTDAFIAKYWRLNSDSSMVFANTCLGTSGAFSENLQDGLRDAGATTLVGWNNVVPSLKAAEAAVYLYNILAGTEHGMNPLTPPRRPFDLASVMAEVQAGGVGKAQHPLISGSGYSALTSVPLTDSTTEVFRQLTPTIKYLVVQEAARKLLIFGTFGTGPGLRQVTLNGQNLNINTWTDTAIEAQLPVGTIGPVQVSYYGHPSNVVPLSRWRGTLDELIEFTNLGSEQVKVTWKLSFRGDAHGYRGTPGQAPGLVGTTNLMQAEPSSTATYTASGSWTDGTTARSLRGSGSLTHTFEMSGTVAPGVNAFAATLQAFGTEGQMTYTAAAMKAAAITEDVTSPNGSYTNTIDLTAFATGQIPYSAATFTGKSGQRQETEGTVRRTYTWSGFTVENPPTATTQRSAH